MLGNHVIVSLCIAVRVDSSTDSQLKLWQLSGQPSCVRTFRGHLNEKNFVGLATDGDYLACGQFCWHLVLFCMAFVLSVTVTSSIVEAFCLF